MAPCFSMRIERLITSTNKIDNYYTKREVIFLFANNSYTLEVGFLREEEKFNLEKKEKDRFLQKYLCVRLPLQYSD